MLCINLELKFMYSSHNAKPATKPRKHQLEPDQILEKIQELSNIITDERISDIDKLKEIDSILIPEDHLYRQSKLQQIIFGNGSKQSPLRIAIERKLPNSTAKLIKLSGSFHLQSQCDRLFEYKQNYYYADSAEKAANYADRGCVNHHIADLILLMRNTDDELFRKIHTELAERELSETKIEFAIQAMNSIILDASISESEKVIKISHILYPKPKSLNVEREFDDFDLYRIIQGDGDKHSPLRLAIEHNLLEVYKILIFAPGAPPEPNEPIPYKRETALGLFRMSSRFEHHSPEEIRLLTRDKPKFAIYNTFVYTPASSPAVSPSASPLLRSISSSPVPPIRFTNLVPPGLMQNSTSSCASSPNTNTSTTQVDFLFDEMHLGHSSYERDAMSEGAESSHFNPAPSLFPGSYSLRQSAEHANKQTRLGNNGLGGETPPNTGFVPTVGFARPTKTLLG